MSFSQPVNETMEMFIEKLSNTYKINKDELYELWNKQSTTQTLNETDLNKLSKQKLIELCKSKGLKCSGTKEVLINILQNKDNISKISPKKTSNASSKKPDVVKQITSFIPNISIYRNKFNNFEHKETLFIFDKPSQKVIGKQNENGKIDSLTKDDINLCNKYKFSYIIPENLDTKNNLNSIHIEELEDEDEDEVEDEVENVEVQDVEVEDVEDTKNIDDMEDEEFELEDEEFELEDEPELEDEDEFELEDN